LPTQGAQWVAELGARVSNWGRWGPEDQLGTLNYVSQETVVRASRLVRAGRIIPLGVALESPGPQAHSPRRRYDPIHLMSDLPADWVQPGDVGVADDVLMLPLQSGTQWDSLAHISFRGRLYNDRSAATVTSQGAAVNSIRAISGHVMGRGVLLDLARYRGVESLAPGEAITAQDLDGALAQAGLAARPGDFLLIRTGFMAACRAVGWEGYHAACPGMGIDTVEWIHEHQMAAVATDTGPLEVRPWAVEGIAVPFHVAALVYMGLLLGEIFDLDGLAADCAADGQYEFLIVAPPLPVTGGIGSPINPYAVK
jgi:kynurenine formamidase